MTIVEEIAARRIPAVIIRETDTVIAFMDHDPINLGHVLICPKKPFRNFIDVPNEVMEAVLEMARDIYKSMTNKFAPDGISFIQCNGEFNDLEHFHLHIFPRHKGDNFSWTCANIGQQTQEQLAETAKGL